MSKVWRCQKTSVKNIYLKLGIINDITSAKMSQVDPDKSLYV